MTVREQERLAVLEQRVNDIAIQLNENTKDTKAIRTALDNLSGGKQALLWITGTFIAILGVIATWLAFKGK
jgi:hypothetical protein